MELDKAVELLRRDAAHWLAFSEEERRFLKQWARILANSKLYVNGNFLDFNLAYNTGPSRWAYGPVISQGCNDGTKGAHVGPS